MKIRPSLPLALVLAAAFLSSRSAVACVTGRHLFVLAEDDLDVPNVVRHRIIRPREGRPLESAEPARLRPGPAGDTVVISTNVALGEA
jgi:hypothetical protein